MPQQSVPRILEFVHDLLQRCVQAGDTVIDATMGNGHDTLALAQHVGSTGQVISFDIQPQALANTLGLLQQAGLEANVQLRLESHEHLAQNLSPELHGAIKLVIFNLGYLPGADKRITTRVDTTLTALEQALSVLRPQGLLIVVVYPGHAQGLEEHQALTTWVKALDSQYYIAAHYGLLNLALRAPYVLAIEKIK
ncbi:tRNA (mnm(5)s(2)U34)-methyltransferase [Brackiella oedipodis]|uniref:tRNA (mnm(5)s(2)U34)-methyltransferase n=1 Tax=Brackiella oedipodis TaxID=124225 RepID=UPI000570DB43|nr:class I SAM-dependent methyltransferase [Brackiella oedipodis]